MSKDVIFYCPKCGSPSVDYSALTGGAANCKVCSWKGGNHELYGTPFEHMLGGREGIGHALFNDLRKVFSTQALMTEFLAFLARWGFINMSMEQKELVRNLSRYAAAATRGILKSIIEERQLIEKEKQAGNDAG